MKRTLRDKVLGKQIGKFLMVALLLGFCMASNRMDANAEYKKVEESELPLSTMHVYRDMDTSFLKTFPFGTTYEGEVFIEVETAQQMIDSTDIRFKVGRVVQTTGFYEPKDGGGATYLISAEQSTGSIQLANGLYADIIMDTKIIDGEKWGIISPKQLGAKGDGESAENIQINAAIAIAGNLTAKDESIFRSIVYLPQGQYKCTNEIQLNYSKLNFVGEGNKSVIFTDNDYRDGLGYAEFFFSVWGATDLYMADFYVEAREVNGYNYMRQMVFVDCDNVYTYRVNLNIPQEAFSKDYYVDKQYSSLTYYSGNKNMTLDSCKLELMCSTYRGANIGVLDFYSRGEENVTIMNCELHSDARDEQVGIFTPSFGTENTHIKNVYFVNNTMYSYQPLDQNAAGGWRHMCFTVAYNDSQRISNVCIKGNHFIADLDSKLMTFGDGIQSCVVENNMMDIRCTSNNGAFLFDSSVSSAERVLIQNNEIYLTDRDSRTGKAAILGGKATVKGNKIISDTSLNNMGYLNGIYEDNTYINLGYLGSLALNVKEVGNNTLISYGKLDRVINFTGSDNDEEVNFSDNYIVDYRRVYEANNVWNDVVRIKGTFKELNFTGNTYLAPNKYYWTWESMENPRVAEFTKGLFFHTAAVEKVSMKNNVMQGAMPYYAFGCTLNEIVSQASAQNGEELSQAGGELSTQTLTNVRAIVEADKGGENAANSQNAAESSQDTTNIVSENVISEASVSGNIAEETVVEEFLEQAGDTAVVNIEASNNVSKEYTLNPDSIVCSSVQITRDGVVQTEIYTEQSEVTLGTIVKAGHMNDDGEYTDEEVVTDKELVWYSSLEGVGTVQNGVVTRNNYGQVTIFAVPTDGAYKTSEGSAIYGKCNIHFIKGFATGLTFEKDNITLQTSKKYRAVYEVTPVDKASQKVEWTSSNPEVATVSSIGVIEAVAVGEADITCTTLDGTAISKKIHVKVEPLTVKKINLNYRQLYDFNGDTATPAYESGVNVGDTYQLKADSYTPSEAVNCYVGKWVSTDESVATVDENGLITVVGPGTCEIRAYTSDEKYYSSCSVFVNPEKLENIQVSYTHSSATFTWDAQPKMYGYRVYRYNTTTSAWELEKEIQDSSTTSYSSWNLSKGTEYQYYITPYLKRWDFNGYSHIYEGPSDPITFKTYAESVLTNVKTQYNSVGVNVDASTYMEIYVNKELVTVTSEDESIATVEDVGPNANINLKVTGVKEGLTYISIKANDEKGYTKRIPVLVGSFEKIGSNVTAEGLVKAISIKWKVEDFDNLDGFVFAKRWGLLEERQVYVPKDEVTLETDENGEVYAKYVFSGLDDDKEYSLSVAPGVQIDDIVYAGPASNIVSAKTLVYVNVDSILAENLHLIKIGESKTITATIGTANASEPKLVWVPYHPSMIQITESGMDDEVTGHAEIKGLKSGVTKLNVVAADTNNYQVQLKIVVLPKQATGVVAETDASTVSLKWNACTDVDGYVVYRFDDAQKQWVAIASVEETSFVDSELNSDTEYLYKIGTYVSDEETVYEGEQSEEITVHTLKSVDEGNGNDNKGSVSNNDPQPDIVDDEKNPDDDEENPDGEDSEYYENSFEDRKIADFKVGKNYQKKVKLSWTKDKDAQGYEIYQYKSKKWVKVATIKNGSTTSKTINKLQPGTSYKFRIRGYKTEDGETIYTGYKMVKVMTTPSKVKVTGIWAGKKQVLLKWKKLKASGYEIQCSTSAKFKKNVTKVAVKKSKTTKTVTKLESGKTYYVRIRAYSKVNGVKYYGLWSKVKKIKVE